MIQYVSLDLMVRKFLLHSPLSADDRAALLALPAELRSYEPGEMLVREGEPPRMCAVLIEGFACRVKTTSAGARQIVALHVPGDAVDIENLYLVRSDHAVQALTRVRMATVAHDRIDRLLAQHLDIARAVARDMLISAAILREWLLNIGRRDARARIAHLLCEFAVRVEAVGHAARDGYTLPMTQEQLGDALGLTPVHVNRTLRLLEVEGLIARDRRTIAIPDWRRMQDAADFDPRYLHFREALADA